MGFAEKPMASTGKKKLGDGWLVLTLNVGGVPKREMFFRSEAEADVYLLSQYPLVHAENGQ
ncbi:hypothetical protein [Rhizobium sp. LC145]|uniref:hypothetical protein n=1 Tax=Rhizobium sp. LC145 TaxID=1120688 RepID=UPI00062A4337|nr:hypothetical protein [Rhizobium sp. LC145]KKX25307.1 hypothetical protein YH62_25515 [Rhizobium sp. LC145]TKT45331.1 hypothetical protein FDR95_25680 [Rhizobiaceae bacterium LC148]